MLALLLALAGCGLVSGEAREGVSIPPVSAGPDAELGLGPEARPLSFGPGDKGSPRIDSSGERVAFVLDGYVAEKPLYARDISRRTANEAGTEGAEWLPDGSLAFLSPEDASEDRDAKTTPPASSLFAAQPEGDPPEGSSGIRKLADGVGAADAAPTGGIVAAVVRPAEEPSEEPKSRLTLLQSPEETVRFYPRSIKGHVTGLSVSPDGQEAVLAVRRKKDRFEVQVYSFSEGSPRRVTRLPEGMEILGAPQWTPQGFYFVAGEVDEEGEAGATRDGDPIPYALYRATGGSETPEPVRGVGEDFVAASIGVSPEGGRLAVVGRRNPGSPTNLYVLDLVSQTLEAATTNENAEIKTNPRDLAWSPDGRYVILVARGALSGPEVYDVPADALSSAFYNLYEVPIGNPIEEGGG